MGHIRNVSEKLERLLPMLSSPNDGEVLNTVRAVTRVLESDALDWHDLTRAVVGQPRTKVPHKPEQKKGWRSARTGTGSVIGNVGGYNCTISRSHRTNSWRVVVNTTAGPVWHNNFESVEAAQRRMEELYGAVQ